MKKIFKALIGVSALAVAGAAVYSAALYKNAADGAKTLPATFTVTAHTGCEGTEDNSLDAIIAGEKAGAGIVEFDLRFDSSGQGILAHDEYEPDPVTLEEAFSTVSDFSSLKVNVDCKTTDNLVEVRRLSEKYGIADRIFYTGIEEKDVPAAKEQTPEIIYYLNCSVNKFKKNDEEYIKSLIDLVKENGAVGLNINYSGASKKMVEMFRKENLEVSLWTANNIVEMLRCISLSPDNITTRHPSSLIKLINNFSK